MTARYLAPSAADWVAARHPAVAAPVHPTADHGLALTHPQWCAALIETTLWADTRSNRAIDRT
ncbi:MAG: hypothetical protein GEU83_10840 [Pseudonocardiaceae bacterium]|nr:hypothetical protein [Pseudonocardiaceae bacterium]